VFLKTAATCTTPVSANKPGDTTINESDQWNPVIAVQPNGSELFVGCYDRSADASKNTLIHPAGERSDGLVYAWQ
jgi:hypothetical protein